jgi:lycopene beta-cyclase
LLVDRDSKQHNDRTWCFWGSPQTPFVDIARHSWQKIAIRDGDFERIFPLGGDDTPGWRYWMVRGIDYYDHARARLRNHPNVEFRLGSVEAFQEEAQRVLVTVDGETLAARWVFDSIIRPGDLELDPARQHVLKQHFTGWEIETPHPVFDPSTATMFDFTTPQKDDLRFFYVLPFSETRALVEYTIFSPALLPDEEYDAALRAFIRGRLGIEQYTVDFVEHNWIPMTDYPFARRAGARIMNIGTKGGLVKPSTGYAFKRMQRDALAIVASLVQYGNPFQIARSPRRYWFYDRLLLQILYRQGQKMKPIFVQLFARNPIARIFHFLDEDAAPGQDLALIASLPPWPFLKALLRVMILKKI